MWSQNWWQSLVYDVSYTQNKEVKGWRNFWKIFRNVIKKETRNLEIKKKNKYGKI